MLNFFVAPSSRPILALVITFWIGIGLVAALLLILEILGQQWVRLKLRLAAARARRRYPTWPELSAVPPSAWQQTLNWSGWSGRAPWLRGGAWLAAALLIFFIFTGYTWLALLILIIAVSTAGSILRAAAARRRLFLRQLPDGLQSLVDTLRAGYSLPQATAFVAAELNAPLAAVFAALERAFSLNLDLSEALRRLSIQLNSREWSTVAETLIAQQALGGNIIPLLQEQAKAVRDHISAEEEIKTLTASGRMSGLLIAILMPLVVVFFLLVSPSYITVLFQTPLGRALFGLALGLEIVGFLWIHRVTRIVY